MIIEHEVIEQLEHEPYGRTLEWCVALVSRLGARDATVTLRRMWQAGLLEIATAEGEPLPTWRIEEVWRGASSLASARVLATDAGSRIVHGADDGADR